MGNPAHSPTTAAGRCLDQQREPDTLCLIDDDREAVRSVDGDRLERARDDRDIDRVRESARMQLVAEGLDRRGRRPDEHDPCSLHRARECCPLGEEPVTGVDRIGAGGERRVDDKVDPQVAVGGCGRANA